MLETISQLLAQLSIFYLLTKTILATFGFPILNISILVNETAPPDPASAKNASLSSALYPPRAAFIPSTQARFKNKPRGISSKQRTSKIKKPRCKITPKINEMGPPGLQCATM